MVPTKENKVEPATESDPAEETKVAVESDAATKKEAAKKIVKEVYMDYREPVIIL